MERGVGLYTELFYAIIPTLFLCFCYIFNVFILVKYQGPLQFLCHLVLDYPSDLRCANTAAWYVLANFQGDGVSGKRENCTQRSCCQKLHVSGHTFRNKFVYCSTVVANYTLLPSTLVRGSLSPCRP